MGETTPSAPRSDEGHQWGQRSKEMHRSANKSRRDSWGDHVRESSRGGVRDFKTGQTRVSWTDFLALDRF